MNKLRLLENSKFPSAGFAPLRRVRLAASLSLGALGLVSGLTAQRNISLSERVAKAELIVVGQVKNTECRWGGKNKGMIYTYVTITVEKYIKGSPIAGELIVNVPGGVIEKDNIGVVLTAPMPHFSPAERVLAMLSLHPDEPYYYVVDSPYGKYSISPYGKVGGQKSIEEFVQEIKNIMAAQE